MYSPIFLIYFMNKIEKIEYMRTYQKNNKKHLSILWKDNNRKAIIEIKDWYIRDKIKRRLKTRNIDINRVVISQEMINLERQSIITWRKVHKNSKGLVKNLPN